MSRVVCRLTCINDENGKLGKLWVVCAQPTVLHLHFFHVDLCLRATHPPLANMKLDTHALRYLTSEDWRVLAAVSRIVAIRCSTVFGD